MAATNGYWHILHICPIYFSIDLLYFFKATNNKYHSGSGGSAEFKINGPFRHEMASDRSSQAENWTCWRILEGAYFRSKKKPFQQSKQIPKHIQNQFEHNISTYI